MPDIDKDDEFQVTRKLGKLGKYTVAFLDLPLSAGSVSRSLMLICEGIMMMRRRSWYKISGRQSDLVGQEHQGSALLDKVVHIRSI